ncbi:involucrin [Musca domestica]|uniref:Involucrin n=1 Tax=Musca domestica TaxID=7370 RepID=A0A1I8NL50_MUSDO|nr:involucrin [Musca domestica]
MKFAIVALALLGVVAADVSHLNNEYLPPHMAALAHKHFEYAEQSQEIPQAQSVKHVSVSVHHEVQAPQQQYYTGLVHHAEQEEAAAVEETQPEPEQQYYTGLVYKPEQEQEEEAVSNSVVEEVQQEPEQQYYTGLVYKPEQEEATSTNVVEETEQQQYYTGAVINEAEQQSEPEAEEVAAEPEVVPGSDDFTQQQAEYYTSVSHQQEAAHAQVVPGSDHFTQQQASYYTSVSHKGASVSSSASASSGIDTKYGSNGGYVY